MSTVIFGHYFLNLSVEEALAYILVFAATASVLLILAIVVLLKQAVRVFDVFEGHVLVDARLERRSKTIDGRLVATNIITIYSEEAGRGALSRFADQSRIRFVRRLEPLAFRLIRHALCLCEEENLFARHQSEILLRAGILRRLIVVNLFLFEGFGLKRWLLAAHFILILGLALLLRSCVASLLRG